MGPFAAESTASTGLSTHSHLLSTLPSPSPLTFAIVPDVAQPNAFDEAVRGVHGVIHTASPYQVHIEDNVKDLLEPAVKGTTEVLKAVAANAPNVKRVIITSSFAAINDPTNGSRPG